MENPNIYEDHEIFMVGNYKVNIRYKRQPDLSNEKYLDTINGYQRYTTSTHPSYFYFIKDDFYGLGSEIILG